MEWSFSTHTTMRRCQRAFIFGRVMAAHNARDAQRREAHILKQLQRVSAWQGGLVHTVLATDLLQSLRAGRPVDPNALTDAAQSLARRQFAFSAARCYRSPGQTKKAAGLAYAALFDHEDGHMLQPETLASVDVTLAHCFQNLATQEDFLAYLRASSGFEAERTLRFRLNGVTVVAKLDLLCFQDRRPIVVDWKVADSDTSDYSHQLMVYALAIERCGRWAGLSAEDVELYEVNLLKNQIHWHRISVQRLEEAEDFIYRSMVEMADLVGNAPFEMLDINEYAVAERPGTCAFCNFRTLCMQRLVLAGRARDGATEGAVAVQERLW